MPDEKARKRDAPLSWRPPKALREEFHARVEKSGLSASAFITKAIFAHEPPRQSRRPPVEKELLARLLADAGHIRNALDEVARAGGVAPAHGKLIEAACGNLTEIRAALIVLLGRQP